jgi:lysophospholipase L1-like esterase
MTLVKNFHLSFFRSILGRTADLLSSFTPLSIIIISLLFILPVSACPKVAKLPDFNCDGEARIVVMGDSLVFGFGDTANDNKGGYVLRTQRRFPGATISNFGVLGLKTQDLLLDIERAFDGRGESSLANALVKADVVILDVGRNDRWLFGEPAATFRNLKRASALIKKLVTQVVDTPPLVITAVMMFPNRGSQGPWMKDLDALILRSHSAANPANLRFDLVSKRLLSQDQIHPTPKGYAALAAVLIKYLTNEYPKIVAKLRPDADMDGLYDIFEKSRFNTDSTLADTDGDGLVDGKDPEPTSSHTLPSGK